MKSAWELYGKSMKPESVSQSQYRTGPNCDWVQEIVFPPDSINT
jgi:hypothetical protein